MQSCTSNLTLVKSTLWLGVRINLGVAGTVNGLEAEICGALKAAAKHCSAFNRLRVQYLHSCSSQQIFHAKLAYVPRTNARSMMGAI
jgi:hypothetical protein